MTDAPQPYRVLARKYRPVDFSTLIGQEAMVRTLSNAIESARLAHAFILTGVRGVGKTTTARIIARALNCVGADGQGGPTPNPCGACEHCASISEDRHVDVLEMDAASRTGVDDIRDLIDGVLYRPVTGRFKIYIVDEVHMLSRNAFNALLKTLEEPPEHVKFIFATTEIRRVPVTVLSRCQRFDLRRVGLEVLAGHFSEIARKEGASVSEGAIALIARAADGSVRDGLSLLDQAVAHGGPGAEIGEEAVREMLGVAERVHVVDLFERLMKGEIAQALELFDSMYGAGADPVTILRDLAELTHWLTRLKAAPGAAGIAPAFDMERGRGLSERLPMAALARTWQMLLKGIEETRNAPSAAQAAEMVLVRIAYVADLPTPADLAAALRGKPATASGTQGTPAPAASGERSAASPAPPPVVERPAPAAPSASVVERPATATSPVPVVERPAASPANFVEAVDLFESRGERLLHAYLVNNAHLVRFEAGNIALRLTEEAPRDLPSQVAKCLSDWTGAGWTVESRDEKGSPTLRQQRKREEEARRAAVRAHPAVAKALEAFPGAKIREIRTADAPFGVLNGAAEGQP